MIILMHGWDRSIVVGDKTYYEVGEITWKCWKKFFRWAYENRLGTYQVFQGGWGLKWEP